jgi:hypothetical protein
MKKAIAYILLGLACFNIGWRHGDFALLAAAILLVMVIEHMDRSSDE